MTDQRVRRDFPTGNRSRTEARDASFARADLRDVARMAARLTPYSGDPERFYLHREEVVTRLHALADAMEAGR